MTYSLEALHFHALRGDSLAVLTELLGVLTGILCERLLIAFVPRGGSPAFRDESCLQKGSKQVRSDRSLGLDNSAGPDRAKAAAIGR